MPPKRIHISGGPAAGKSTLSKQIADRLQLPRFELDELFLKLRSNDLMAVEAARIAQQPAWVSGGVFLDWAKPLFDEADLVVWLDVPWRVASFRILARHMKLTIARNNPFPGWKRLSRFWRWSRRYYRDAAIEPLNQYGAPNDRQTTVLFMETYKSKLVLCRTNSDIDDLLARLSDER